MTETWTGPTASEDIDAATDATTAPLDRQADAMLMEGESPTFGSPPLREAVHDDVTAARDWGRIRARRLKGAVEAEPVKASLYALGLGVVIGMLIAR